MLLVFLQDESPGELIEKNFVADPNPVVESESESERASDCSMIRTDDEEAGVESDGDSEIVRTDDDEAERSETGAEKSNDSDEGPMKAGSVKRRVRALESSDEEEVNGPVNEVVDGVCPADKQNVPSLPIIQQVSGSYNSINLFDIDVMWLVIFSRVTEHRTRWSININGRHTHPCDTVGTPLLSPAGVRELGRA